jgi:transcriptional regulator with XRE-family HTH domain
MTNPATQTLLDEQLRMCGALGATSAAIAIVQMDPHIRNDLALFLQSLNETQSDLTRAREAGDQDQADELEEDMGDIVSAIVELFEHNEIDQFRNAPTLDSFEADLRVTHAGELEHANERAALNRLVRRYHEAKARSGLETIAQVAEAAGLSPTTVQAVESGRVRPHYRTVKKLAEAFGVELSDLLAD